MRAKISGYREVCSRVISIFRRKVGCFCIKQKTAYEILSGRVGSGMCFFVQAEDGIRDQPRSRGLGVVYMRQDQQAAGQPPAI